MFLPVTKDGDVKVKVLVDEIENCADPAICKASKKLMMKTSIDPREGWTLVDLVEVLAGHHGLHCMLFHMLGELIQPFDKRIHNECWPTMKASSPLRRPNGKVLGKITKDSAALVKEWKLYDRNRMILRNLKCGKQWFSVDHKHLSISVDACSLLDGVSCLFGAVVCPEGSAMWLPPTEPLFSLAF